MSTPKTLQPVKLIASIITADPELMDAVCLHLENSYGPIDYRSNQLPFNYTDYYEAEIGAGLFRHFVTIRDLIAPESLPGIKLFANNLEATCARPDGTRRVNIDPGYITLHHLILATCKNFAHRPYLRDGVFADLTLLYKGGTFTALDWTFPDYRSPELIMLLNGLRDRYYEQLKPCDAPGLQGGKRSGQNNDSLNLES